MDHSIVVTGSYYELRPVTLDDAGFMVRLRTDPELSRFLNTTSPCVEDQENYLRKYFSRSGDYYFIVQDIGTKSPEGMLSIYDIDPETGKAEWGRWILRKGSMAAVECACLVYRAGFEVLGVKQLYCRTVAQNRQVVSFHESCGLKLERKLPGYVKIGDRIHDSLEQSLTVAEWGSCRPGLEAKAERIAELLGR